MNLASRYTPIIAMQSPTGSVRNPKERRTKDIRTKHEAMDSARVSSSKPRSFSSLWKTISVVAAQKKM